MKKILNKNSISKKIMYSSFFGFVVMAFIACNGYNSKIVGKWHRQDGNITSEANYYEDGTATEEVLGMHVTGKWSIEGDSIFYTGEDGVVVHYKIIRLNDKELFVKYKDQVFEYYKVKN